MPDADTFSEAIWNAWAERGQRETLEHVLGAAIDADKRSGKFASIAVMMGSLIELTRAMRTVVDATPQAHRALEDMLMAYVRGAARGLDVPVRDDGSHYTGSFDG